MFMKRFIFLLTGLLLTTLLFGQQLIANKYPAWSQPVIKRLIAKDPGVTGYGVKANDKFINIAALDRQSKVLYWISCEGYIIEASQLTDADYRLLVSNKADPFQLYQLLYQKDLQITDNAIDKLRFPENKFYSRTDPNYDGYLTRLIKVKRIDTLPMVDQKLAALYKDEQNYLYHLGYIQAGHPLKVKPDSIYRTILSQVRRGSIQVSEHTDSVGTAVFYNKDGLSPVYKAVLNIPSATLCFYLADQSVFDSISINRKQILKLIDEGTDVFTLYQNYTLWQLCMLDSTVRQLHDYYAKTKPGAKEREAVQYLLAGFGGSKEALFGKLEQLEQKTLLKLKRLFDVDEGNLEQGLWSSFKYSTVPVRYGQYVEGKGLVISDPIPPYSPPVVYSQTRGNKLYELTDQRGNVMAVVSDKRIQHDDNGDNMVDYYTADVVKATDYSPFGKPLPGRTIEMRDYKYGYNGKENDVETGYQNYGFRMYDPNLARFISLDPLTKIYPELTPYQFASNRPISGIDLDGREVENFIFGMKKKIFGVSSLKMNNLNTVIGEVQQQSYTINIGDPTRTVNELQNQIAKDINSIYGTDKGTFEFEKQQKPDQITKGDFINIDPGLKGLDMAVKVADVQTYDNNKIGTDVPHTGFSLTFRTLEGHVEVGSIKFTALEFTNPETGAKSFQFNISSTSQIDNGLATTILNGFARKAQQQVWQQVLKNVSVYMGGNVESAGQRIDKYKIADIEPVKNSETSIGYPKIDAVPTSTETKDLEIKNK